MDLYNNILIQHNGMDHIKFWEDWLYVSRLLGFYNVVDELPML